MRDCSGLGDGNPGLYPALCNQITNSPAAAPRPTLQVLFDPGQFELHHQAPPARGSQAALGASGAIEGGHVRARGRRHATTPARAATGEVPPSRVSGVLASWLPSTLLRAGCGASWCPGVGDTFCHRGIVLGGNPWPLKCALLDAYRARRTGIPCLGPRPLMLCGTRTFVQGHDTLAHGANTHQKCCIVEKRYSHARFGAARGVSRFSRSCSPSDRLHRSGLGHGHLVHHDIAVGVLDHCDRGTGDEN